MVENQGGASVKGGKKHGWIELYNGGSRAVNLAEWHLSDTPTNLTKWRFPHFVMLPGSYLVISASGLDRTNDPTGLHANFLLDTNGGQVTLVARATNLVSRFVYPKSAPNISFGSMRAEPSLRGSFPQPTPGKPNQTKGPGFAPAVTFSHPSGPIVAPIALALSCSGPSASSNLTIRYTLDGSMPHSRSTAYREPIQLTNTAVIRARAFQEGLLPGPPESAVYTWLEPEVQKFRSNLPVLVVNVLGIEGPASAQAAYLSFYEPVAGKTSLKNRPALVTRGDAHPRGSSTMRMPQPSLAVEFRDEFNEDEKHPVLGLPAESDWVLYAPNMFDPVLIHNPFVHQLSRDMGRYSSRTRFVEVYLVLHSGAVKAEDYAGLYVLEEKIKIGKNRVAIEKLGASDLKEPDLTGGYLLKFDRLGPLERGFWAGGAELVYVDPKEEAINLPQRAAQRRYISNFLDSFENALQGPDWRDPKKGYPAFIDIEAWIDFHVLQVLSGNVDIFRYSTYFYKPRGGKLVFGPHWDFDRALGSIDRRDAYPRRWNTGRFFEGAWWRQIFTDPDFWQLWVDRWQALRQTHFSQANMFGLIDRLAEEVREAQGRQAARWGLEPRGGTYQSEIDLMKRWLSERIDFIDRQLVQPPKFSREGGEVKSGFELMLTGPEGATIYFTLDGSDPRQSQGEVSPQAQTYSKPIPLSNDVRVKARAWNSETRQVGGPPVSTPWSGPVSATFTIKQ